MESAQNPVPVSKSIKGISIICITSIQTLANQVVPTAVPATVPDGYKIVKVRKPDGTIVKVRRPISKTTNAAATSSTSSPIAKDPPKPIEAPSSPPVKIQEPSKTVTARRTPRASTPKATTEKSSGSKEAAEKVETPQAHASKLETTAKGFRLFRRFHRVHRHASRLVEAFDPYSDIGDLQDGDEYMGSDDDYNSASEESDDEDRNNRNQQPSGGEPTKGASTGAHVNVNVGRTTATQRAVPAPKQAKKDISAREIQREKSSSTDSDLIVREKELLEAKDLEAAEFQPKPPRSLHRRSADWAKLIVWTLVIAFPIIFIGKFSTI